MLNHAKPCPIFDGDSPLHVEYVSHIPGSLNEFRVELHGCSQSNWANPVIVFASQSSS